MHQGAVAFIVAAVIAVIITVFVAILILTGRSPNRV